MYPFVRIFVPDNHQPTYQVVLFLSKAMPDVHEAETEKQAEELAARLARMHHCDYKFMPATNWDVIDRLWTEDGGLRKVDRIEFVALGDGVFQFILWDGKHRLFTQTGHATDMECFFDDVALLMQ